MAAHAQQGLYLENIYSETDIRILPDVVYAVVEPGGYWYDMLRDFEPLNQNEELQGLLTKELRADVYLPPAASYRRPLAIVLHGGGFLAGNKKDKVATIACMNFARRGYVAASINYRQLGLGKASFLKAGYTAIQDTRAAMRFFRNHADSFGIHPGFLFLVGESTGAVIVLHAAFLSAENLYGEFLLFDRQYGALDAIGEEGDNGPPCGVVNISGGITDTALLNNYDIPLISFHGGKDEVINPYHALPREKLIERFDGFLQNLGDKLGLALRSPFTASSGSGVEQIRLVDSLFGSAAIHQHFSRKGEYPQSYVDFPGMGHHLVASRQGVPRQTANIIFKRAAHFLYPTLRDTAKIYGRKEAPPRTRITYRSVRPAVAWKWSVEGGHIVAQDGPTAEIKWDAGATKGVVSLITTNEIGVQSLPAQMAVVIRQYEFREWARITIDEGNWPLSLLIVALGAASLALVAWWIRKKR